MSFVDITRHNGDTVDQAERDNIPDWRHVRGQGDKPARRAALDWRVSLTIVLFVGGLFTYFFIRFVQFIGAINQEVSTLDIYLWGAFKVALFLTPMALLGLAVWYVYGIARAKQVIRLQNNVPVHMRDLESAQWLTHIVQPSQAAYYSVEGLWASNSKYRSLNQLALNGRNDDMPVPTIAELTDEQSTAIQPVPPSEWLEWVNNTPHVIFAAETGGGKTTTVKAILAQRIAAGEKVFVLDPHSAAWGVPSIGGGQDWNAIKAGISAVCDEYQRRLDKREAHLKATGEELQPDYFQRLTVVLDEANAAKTNLDRGKRGEPTPWVNFVEILGSGARKVRISVFLIVQSALVEDMGITSAMLRNFTRIGLDSVVCRKLVDSVEKNAQNKRDLHAALAGREYPAVTEYQGKVYLLDRTGIDKITMPATAKEALWEGFNDVYLSSLLGANDGNERGNGYDDNGNEVPCNVPASESDVSEVPEVTITPEEAAKITALLDELPFSEVVKRLDNYHARNYKAFATKVRAVQQMLEAA